MSATLERARAAFARQAWTEAYEGLSTSGSHGELGAADLERLAVAAYLVGEDDRSEAAWETAHRRALEAGDPATAARCACWLGLCSMLRGSPSRASGWLARADSVIADSGIECAASGYLLVMQVVGSLEHGDTARALELADRAVELGKQFDDADLRALGVLGQGQARIAAGDVAGGTARLDEVMVSVTAGEVGPIATGIVYCAVVLECMALFDLARASEWTSALTAWCEHQPDLVPYRGQCLVHRSQLQMVAGEWSDAITTAAAACRRLADPPHPALGLACYQEAELHRLVGDDERAASGYRQASRHGHDPMPGLALLELARGDPHAAATAIRRALREATSPTMLMAGVDILVRAGDLDGARAAADELATIARTSSSSVLRAMAREASGAVLVAADDAEAGLAELRAAAVAWETLRMPYEAARTASWIGIACAALGDHTAAGLELDTARTIFTELGATFDLDRLAALDTRSSARDDAGLSAREREVLEHLAAGETNRQIAASLYISRHTVGRHVESIFAKLGVNTRAAATARAYELGLVTRAR